MPWSGSPLALAISLIAGAVLASSRFVEQASQPILVLVLVAPWVAYFTSIVAWLGRGDPPVLFLVTLVAVPAFTFAAVAGLRSSDPAARELLASVNASRLEVLWRLRLPSASPVLLATSRYVIGLALAAAYYGEGGNLTSVGEGGLGTIGRSAASLNQGRPLWATVFATVLLGVIGLGLVSLIERVLLRWHVSQRQQSARRQPGANDAPVGTVTDRMIRPTRRSIVSLAAVAAVPILTGASAPTEPPGSSIDEPWFTEERCAANRDAGTITYLTGFGFAAAASMVDVFVAEERGYYDELCLDVEVVASFSTDNYPLIAADEAQFASGGSFSEVINFATANDADLVAVVVEGRFPIDALIVKPGMAETLADLDGATIGVKGAITPSVEAMLAGAGLVEGEDYQTVLARRVRSGRPHRHRRDRRLPRLQEQRAGSARPGRHRVRACSTRPTTTCPARSA